MNRTAGALASVLLLTSCAGGLATLEQDLTRAAQEQVMKTLAGHYTRALGKGIGTVVDDLARPGGYLDNPLVRILLPPPVMLALDIARELHADPQAGMLDVLINSAAEQAIPGATPILQAAIAGITPGEARGLLEAGRTAGTDYLKEQTATALRTALGPQIAAALEASGALQSYAALVAPPAGPQPPAAALPPGIALETLPEAPAHAGPPDLEDYVTEQAIDGLFKVLALEEARIREELERTGLLQR